MSKSLSMTETVTANLRKYFKAEFFMGRNGEPMTTIVENGKIQSFDLRYEKWQYWLILYLRSQKLQVTKHKREEIGSELIALAMTSGDHRDLFVRAASFGNKIIIDLGRADFKFVHISEGKVEVTQSCGPAFIRSSKQLPLPIPVRCEQKSFLKMYKYWFFGAHEQWLLILVFLLKCLHRNHGAYVLLIIKGKKDSGKTLLSNRIKSLIDPSMPNSLSSPKVPDDIIVAAANSYLFSYDNISGIDYQIADLFCSVATGGGISKRKLYGDHTETSYRIHNPCLFNGIGEPSPRADFMDRTVTFELEPILDTKRLPPTFLDARFERDYPLLLGGLYQLLADCLEILPTVPSSDLPRMADFARLGVAAERVLSLPPGSFLETYKANLNEQTESSFWSDGLCNAIHRAVERGRVLSGTPTELCSVLFGRDSRDVKLAAPKSVAHFSSWLDRVEGLLAHKGITVSRSRTAQARTIHIQREDLQGHPPKPLYPYQERRLLQSKKPKTTKDYGL